LATVAVITATVIYLISSNTSDSIPGIGEAATTELPVVAVLPFAVTDQTNKDSQFFANGIHDDLLTQLAKLQSLRVISRTSVMEYRNPARNMREIGKELGADAILEGRVQILNNRIHINAQLIDPRTDRHLWAKNYDRELSPANLFAVQSEMARTIAVQLHTTLTDQDSQQLTQLPTENMEAYRAFHRAKRLRDTDPGAVGASNPEYLGALEEAVALDPMFSGAWAELVVNFTYLNIVGRRPEMVLRAEQALKHLQTIAPGSVDHLMAQAAYFYYTLKDYDRAHEIISQALKKNPSNTRALELRGWIERRQGNYEAFLNSRKEAAKLDPRNALTMSALLSAQLAVHRYDEAEVEAKNSVLDSFTKHWTQSFLLFRDHRDFKWLQDSILKLCPFYREPDCGWIEYIAQRDYHRALTSLDELAKIDDEPVGLNDRRTIFTYWLMQDVESLTLDLPRWQAELEEDRDRAGKVHSVQSFLGLAMLAAIQSKPNDAKQWIDNWFQKRPIDWAERTNSRHEACRILGMIGATTSAVKCIRDGLLQPSYIAPFFEPYLPFYDSVRSEPEFIDMLADIGQK
jgi:TolB-like protein